MIYKLEQFYEELPTSHKKYLNKLNDSIKDISIRNDNSISTKTILVYASLGCIDSVVNMMALFLLRKHWNIEIGIILEGDSEYVELQNGQTPTFYGLNHSDEITWTWQRAPQIIKSIEANSPQQQIIVEKMKYRYGYYLQDTLDELIELLESK